MLMNFWRGGEYVQIRQWRIYRGLCIWQWDLLSNFGSWNRYRYIRFCMQIDHGKYYRKDNKLHPNGGVVRIT